MDVATANIRGPTELVKIEVTEVTPEVVEHKKVGSALVATAMGRSVERHKDETTKETFEADVAAGTGVNLDTAKTR